MSREDYKVWANVAPLGDIPESTDIGADLLKLMACPDLASRRWIWEQYDSQVGADTLQKSGGDAAVVRIHGTQKALAMSTDCTPRYCYADPYEGGKQAVAECYRNISAVGALPLAITNCLNFGNPQRPEIMAQIVGCLEGMADACRALDFPIVSGNVSLYNESRATGGGSAILPTPAIGGVGLMADHAKMATIGFKAEGDHIYCINNSDRADWGHLGQSVWLREIHGSEDGPPPPVNLDYEKQNAQFVRILIEQGIANAVHDVSDGGIAVALAEMAMAGGVGAKVAVRAIHAGWAFGEDQGEYLVAVPNSEFARFEDLRLQSDVFAEAFGETGGMALSLAQYKDDESDDVEIVANIPLTALREASDSFFRDWMES